MVFVFGEMVSFIIMMGSSVFKSLGALFRKCEQFSKKGSRLTFLCTLFQVVKLPPVGNIREAAIAMDKLNELTSNWQVKLRFVTYGRQMVLLYPLEHH